MEQYQIVYDKLKELNIKYDVLEHPPALTTADADEFLEGMEGVRTKSIFLCNKKSTSYYLIVMYASKRLDMKGLDSMLGEKGLHFCSAEKLAEKMALYPGAVSLFGILNNDERDIKICLDRDMLTENLITFHPNDNTKTLFISIADMYRFIKAAGYEYTVLDLFDFWMEE